MAEVLISVGRIVHYRIGAQAVEQIMRRRTTGASIADRIKQQSVLIEGGPVPAWPLGAQAHIGSDVHEGDILPLIVLRVWSPTCVNGQVFLDGNDVFWATSVSEGTLPGTWCWPPRT